MDLRQIENVYFIGIGGIGMSALARYFLHLGKIVGGYDRSETVLTKELVKEGMDIHYIDSLDSVSSVFKDHLKTLVIYTPAIPSEHTELLWFFSKGFEVEKRAAVLGLISRAKDVIAVAGTHGKTTTTTMISHLLKHASCDCNAFLGGISLNYSSNLLLSEKSNYVVIEADEYDRSFHHLFPKGAVVTSMDADHLDIYGTYEAYKESFAQFVSQIQPGGFLIIHAGLMPGLKLENVNIFSYSLDGNADFYAKNTRVVDGFYHFDLVTPTTIYTDLKLGFPGILNVENSVAAIAVANLLDATDNEIREAISGFLGVKRRFEYHLRTDKVTYIDDYGHHPQELKYTIQSIKELYPNKRITGIFQPHLYSRTRDFSEEFAQSLSLLDELILLDIYPAREQPIPGVNAKMLLDKVSCSRKYYCSKDNVLELLQMLSLPEVLITMGAGDIDSLVIPIRKLLNDKLGCQ